LQQLYEFVEMVNQYLIIMYVVGVPLRGSDRSEGTVRYVVEASYCGSGNFRC